MTVTLRRIVLSGAVVLMVLTSTTASNSAGYQPDPVEPDPDWEKSRF